MDHAEINTQHWAIEFVAVLAQKVLSHIAVR